MREALRHLESEGLVEFADAKGPRVAIITLEDARDIYELRCVLEGLIVQLFTLNAKTKDIRALERALEVNREALEEGELAQVLDSVQGFYDVLLEGSGNQVAAQQLRQLQARISYLRATSVSQQNRRGASNREMEKIVEAIKSGDPRPRTRPRSTTCAPPPRWPWTTCARNRTTTPRSARSSNPCPSRTLA